jgi:NTP pyrophosphatase (non-canonical NTP hydrolase)
VTEQATLQKAMDTWGQDLQVMMLGEECCECGKEVLKFKAGRKTSPEDLIGEIADVSIMVDQMRLIWGKEIDVVRTQKIARLAERLDEVKP